MSVVSLDLPDGVAGNPLRRALHTLVAKHGRIRTGLSRCAVRATNSVREVRQVLLIRQAAIAIAVLMSVELALADSLPRRPVKVSFDYSAAETLLRALASDSLTEQQVSAVASNHGVAATIRKMQVFFPQGNPQGYDASEEGFKQALRHAVTEHSGSPGAFKLSNARAHRAQIEALLEQIHSRESVIETRMSKVLGRYAPAGAPPRVIVNFVVGGSSDGFVIDDDPLPELFVAVDKAQGDTDGLEYNIDHELYHVLQKASGMRSSAYAQFVRQFEDEPPLKKLMATTLWEGTATFAVDPRAFLGKGPYISMWRGRYADNESAQRRREDFALFDELATDLASGATTWRAAYTKGFSDEQIYHVGREMTRALVAARGPRYMDELFTRPPVQFFQDYIALCAHDSKLIPLAARTRALVGALPTAW